MPRTYQTTAFSNLPADDQQAIGKTLLTLLKGFRDRDAEALRAVYSDDADWVNAFGTVKHGRADPEVVLVSAHLRIKGQGLVGGATMDRDNFSLRALQRQADGSWIIVSEMFQDANTETTYAR